MGAKSSKDLLFMIHLKRNRWTKINCWLIGFRVTETSLTSSDMRIIRPSMLWLGSIMPRKLGWTACSRVIKAKSKDFCTLLVPNDLRPMLLPGVRGSSMQRPSFVMPLPPSRTNWSVNTCLGNRHPLSLIRIPTWEKLLKKKEVLKQISHYFSILYIPLLQHYCKVYTERVFYVSHLWSFSTKLWTTSLIKGTASMLHINLLVYVRMK